MSIHAVSWVLKHSEATGTDRLVLIALADYANDDGGGAWPSVANISGKAKTKERATQYALRRLEEQGHIERSGKTPKGTNVYRVLMGGADRAPVKLSGVQGGAPVGVQPDAPQGVHEAAPKPSNSNRQKQPSRKRTGDSQKAKKPRSGDPFQPLEGDPVDAAVVSLFNRWHAGTNRTAATKLTNRRAGQIRARMREAAEGCDLTELEARVNYAYEEISTAIQGMIFSDWHRQNGHQEFDQMFRSRDCIDKFLSRRREQLNGNGKGLLSHMSAEEIEQYETTKPNPELEPA
jgi:hypothetical protein